MADPTGNRPAPFQSHAIDPPPALVSAPEQRSGSEAPVLRSTPAASSTAILQDIVGPPPATQALSAGTASVMTGPATSDRQFTRQDILDFQLAARNGDLAQVQDFLAQGMHADAQPSPAICIYAIARAAKYGHLDVVKLLHGKGASDAAKKCALVEIAMQLDGDEDLKRIERLKETATELLFSFPRPDAAQREVVQELKQFKGDMAAHIASLFQQ